MSIVPIRRALISVSDKRQLELLIPLLQKHNIEVVSSGGTAKALRTLGLDVTPIEQVTGNPEAFGGRMKTLSFQVSSALLYRRGHEGDEAQAAELGISPIDLVICNLYPFQEVVKRGGDFDEKIENIDIGGPTMVRASAKNFESVCTIVHPEDYLRLIEELDTYGGTRLEFRQHCAMRAFRHTALYDAQIAQAFELSVLGSRLTLTLDAESATSLRYGENPHQQAWLLLNPLENGLAQAKPLQGKPLSYNNMLDADAAYRSCVDISMVAGESHAVTIIKHLNPCGAAVASSQQEALTLAWAGDPVSAFGSIICFNHPVGLEAATFLRKRFIEVVIAPSFTDEARAVFAPKKNLRLIELAIQQPSQIMLRAIDGGYLLQHEDSELDAELKTVTEAGLQVSDALLHFGVMVNKNLKSNAIALVGENDGSLSLWGAGMGNPNRLVSTQQAVEKAKENGHSDLSGALLVSDAFFPFRDNIDAAHAAGVTQVVQPGGSIRDEEVIAACNEFGMAMAVTGRRHFRH